ncbi:DNA mismatch repair protein MutS [Flavobacteriaceae bacterium]|nr:DNA mismatch repair protein MutS [Flavobacteriaceae bacterium]
MSFKVGDKICVLDQDIEGVVTSITAAAIEVETTFGFLMKFSARELLILPEEGLKVSNYDVAKIKHLKQDKMPNYKANVSKKERDVPKMEVDLHIGQLTNATNLSNFEMLNIQLDTAQRQLEFAISKKIQKVVFIHGVGAGVLKEELQYLFKRYDGIRVYEGDYKKYGLGATEVYITQQVSREV